jgi:mono/diheme cytochrome c family protein
MKGLKKKNILAITFIFSSLLLLASTQFPPWEVPADAKSVQNPLEVNKQTLEKGKAVYMNCMACHGATGLGDGAIPSGDFTTKAFMDQTDGTIFYKISNGRGAMPGFKALGDDQLWAVIIYIRSLAAPQEELVKKNATVVLEFDEEDSSKMVTAKVYEILDNGEQTPATEIKVNIYVKRYFADLPIGGSSNYTNSDGSVSVSFPEGIPGKDGKLQIIAKVEDSEFNPAEAIQEVAWGIEKETYWNNDRELWKNNDHVPLWILFSYFGITGGILLAIGFVLLQVVKIRKLGAE